MVHATFCQAVSMSKVVPCQSTARIMDAPSFEDSNNCTLYICQMTNPLLQRSPCPRELAFNGKTQSYNNFFSLLQALQRSCKPNEMSLLQLVACTQSVQAVTVGFKKHKHNVACDALGTEVVATCKVCLAESCANCRVARPFICQVWTAMLSVWRCCYPRVLA